MATTRIETLTDAQWTSVAAHRARYFALATCTDPADRVTAEDAVRTLADIAGVKIDSAVWVSNPQDGARAYGAAWDSLGASLWDSLWASLGASLRASLWDSLWDTGWLAYYAVPRDLLGVIYDPDAARKLDLRIAILESCFAVWIVPGGAILCDRPATVEIVDGRLVGVTWRTPA